ncbi:MAG TPA: hydrogenase assembly protein HupF, partial [Synechococcales bacterium UBA12195]|nr:hydrogenase assembly protein HupF [Synechococcales bacterium UBA12195]
MHEVDMTKCLLLALQQWREEQASPQAMVDTIHLDVGRFTCVEPEQLRFTFQAAVAGSWLDGAQLQIEE